MIDQHESIFNEDGMIRVTEKDISQANRLSLSCPICASAVEKNVDQQALTPIVCANCQTLYHHTCWEQNDDKCAVLGCGHEEFYFFGTEVGPLLTITYADLPKHVSKSAPSSNGRFKELKAQQKRLQEQAAGSDFWSNLLGRIRQAFGWR